MGSPTELKPMTLLLLEDEPFIALDIEEVLSRAGVSDIHTVSTCKGRTAGLSKQLLMSPLSTHG
ncbi:hypothetical protein [Rhizobium sp. LjRoot258]|uniref:hypothetical protein n=1 Tax=Rhizobium sp. LjRoot258 TaxID=3342299 RepID=UPI003ECE239B